MAAAAGRTRDRRTGGRGGSARHPDERRGARLPHASDFLLKRHDVLLALLVALGHHVQLIRLVGQGDDRLVVLLLQVVRLLAGLVQRHLGGLEGLLRRLLSTSAVCTWTLACSTFRLACWMSPWAFCRSAWAVLAACSAAVGPDVGRGDRLVGLGAGGLRIRDGGIAARPRHAWSRRPRACVAAWKSSTLLTKTITPATNIIDRIASTTTNVLVSALKGGLLGLWCPATMPAHMGR